MDYARAFKYVFENPKWAVNVLIGTGSQFVPIVGPIVFQGYLAEVLDWRVGPAPDAALIPAAAPGEPLAYQSAVATYPDFDFNRLGEYLKRGVWPFLAVLVTMVPLIIVLDVLLIPLILLAILLHGAAAVVVIILAIAIYVAAILALPVVLTPVVLRANLARSFPAAFDWGFAQDFLRRVGPLMLINALVSTLVGMGLMVGGWCACCVGIYFTMPIYLFYNTEILAQTYQEYLSRGGMRIAIAVKQ
jgi:hypothetical protein